MFPITTYIFKATAFCNLNCTYCYIFNLADTSFHGRPKVMPDDVVAASARRICEQAKRQGDTRINICFHGGEPLLAGRDWIRRTVECFRETGGEEVRFNFSLQTNGIPLDMQWIQLLDELRIPISVSLDGPRHINDLARVNFAGRGSYDEVVRGLRLLLDTPEGQRILGGVLCVVNPEFDGLEIYRHFRDLGIKTLDFLLPLDHNWDTPPPGHQDPAATPYADYLIPIFDDWWSEDRADIRIRYFETILGQFFATNRGVDSLGGHPVSFAIIDTDGAIEPLDSLRACADGLTCVGLNVLSDPIAALYDQEIFQVALAGQEGLCDTCQICPLHDICGAGYLPHRWKKAAGFRNQSVYCRDLWKLINHILDAATTRVRLDDDAPAGTLALSSSDTQATGGATSAV